MTTTGTSDVEQARVAFEEWWQSIASGLDEDAESYSKTISEAAFLAGSIYGVRATRAIYRGESYGEEKANAATT